MTSFLESLTDRCYAPLLLRLRPCPWRYGPCVARCPFHCKQMLTHTRHTSLVRRHDMRQPQTSARKPQPDASTRAQGLPPRRRATRLLQGCVPLPLQARPAHRRESLTCMSRHPAAGIYALRSAKSPLMQLRLRSVVVPPVLHRAMSAGHRLSLYVCD